MTIHIDLKKAHSHRTHGDLMAILTWIDDERALVLIPHLRPGAPWFIVKDSASYLYDDTNYLASSGKKACEVLGIEPSLNNWVRVATIIHDTLPDLIRMPSSPPAEKMAAAIGQLQLREGGQVIAGQDIVLDKTPGASYASA